MKSRVVFLVCGLSATVLAAELTPAQLRGKQVYAEGRGNDPVEVTVAGGLTLSAGGHPCVQCHGVEGRGGFEGGVKIPGIQWQRLSSPYGVPTYLGGSRPAYTRASFARAVRDGIASSGAELDPVMPRYRISDRDIDDLLAYLKVIGKEDPPGIDASTVRVGALLPVQATDNGQARAVAGILRRYFSRINAKGGIHGRRIELVVVNATADVRETQAAIMRAVNDGGIFTFIANGGPGASPEILRFLEQKSIPVIGPLTFARDAPGQGSVYYLLASLEDQARAAARYLKKLGPELRGGIAVVTGPAPGDGEKAMLRGFAREAEKTGLPVTMVQFRVENDLPRLVLSLQENGIDLVVFFGGRQEGQQFLIQAQKYNWRPGMLASTMLLGGRLRTFTQLHLVMPAVAPAERGDGYREFRKLLSDNPVDMPETAGRELLNPEHRAMEMVAYASGRVLTRVLTDLGRDIHHHGFLEALRDLRSFETGVMPPIHFGPNRRVGVRGALIVTTASSKQAYESHWVELTQ